VGPLWPLVAKLPDGPQWLYEITHATQRSWKNAQDEWSSKTDWHRDSFIWNLRPRQAATAEWSKNEILLPVVT
jgi:hypothetical protein